MACSMDSTAMVLGKRMLCEQSTVMTPKAPRLRPAASPVFIDMMELELPEAMIPEMEMELTAEIATLSVEAPACLTIDAKVPAPAHVEDCDKRSLGSHARTPSDGSTTLGDDLDSVFEYLESLSDMSSSPPSARRGLPEFRVGGTQMKPGPSFEMLVEAS